MSAPYEGLGVFYLGREVDPETADVTPTPVLYDASDLTTHAFVVGMTGSGKTGPTPPGAGSSCPMTAAASER